MNYEVFFPNDSAVFLNLRITGLGYGKLEFPENGEAGKRKGEFGDMFRMLTILQSSCRLI